MEPWQVCEPARDIQTRAVLRLVGGERDWQHKLRKTAAAHVASEPKQVQLRLMKSAVKKARQKKPETVATARVLERRVIKVHKQRQADGLDQRRPRAHKQQHTGDHAAKRLISCGGLRLAEIKTAI